MATLPSFGGPRHQQLNEFLRVAHNEDGTLKESGGGGGGGLTTEDVQDIVGAMASGNTETNIDVSYDDTVGKLNFVSSTVNSLTTEDVQDIVGGMVSGNTETNIAVTYDDNVGKLNFVATGGAGGGDTTLTVAASDSVQAAAADYVCDGTADHVEIQAAIDAVAQYASGGGEVVLLAGTYNTSSTISVGHPSDGVNTYRIHLRFERGAKVRWTGVTGLTPLIKIESSDCVLSNPWVQGSGSKGNGIGICFGGDTTNYGGRYTKTVYRCTVINPYVSNCNYGICFAVDKTGTSSSGDSNVFGGFITNCVDGINSAGFVNRIFGTTVALCTNCLHGTADRNSHMIGVNGCTMNNWSNSAVWLEKDKGSTFVDFWAEHTADQGGDAPQAIVLGGTTNSTYKAHNTRFVGTTSLTLEDETDAIKIINAHGVRIDNLSMSTNGNMPTRAVIRDEATNTGTVTVDRVGWQTGTVPGTWTYANLVSSGGSTGRVIVKAVPGPAGAASNVSYGDSTPTPVDATYFIDKAGSANNATYWAKDRYGHVAMLSADATSVSGLKAVLAALTANDVHFRFGSGRYHFKDAPTGAESWAGTEDHASFGTTSPPIKGLSFSGAGMYSTIISNRTNWAGSTDTEPLSFTNCQYVTIRDLTVESCGTYKSTTDAIDLDQGAHVRIERVRITHSRARGIVIDGGDLGKWGGHNSIRDCLIQGRPDKPGLALVSGGSLTASTAYRYIVSWTDADLAGAQTAGETKPSDEQVITTDASNRSVRVDLAIGPYTVTERKIYRALVGSASWVRVATISDNTTTTYTDTGGAGTGVTMPVSHGSTVYDSAIELLGCSYSNVLNNIIDGTGDFTSGLSRYGINVVRKSSVPTASNCNKVIGNTVRQVASYGIRVLGGADNMVKDNNVSNSGTVATRASCIRVEGAASISTLRNEVKDNRCFDDQDANSWSTGLTVNNQITVASSGTPTDTLINGNILTAGSSGSSATILDQGTNSLIWDNYGWNAEYSLVEYGASQSGNFTVTQAMSNQTILVTGLATVTLPVMKQGSILWIIRDTASAITFATSGTTLDKPAANSASPRAQNSKVCFEWLTTTRILETGDMG